MKLLALSSPWTEPVSARPPCQSLAPALFARDRPDEHWLGLEDGRRVAARCSIWWHDVPRMPNHKLGVIGHYSAADPDTALAVLLQARDRLRAQGCTLAVGPMDGNTWRPYRFISERGTAPPFFLEPNDPEAWLSQWRSAGFHALASYFSAINTNLSYEDPQVTRAGQRLEAGGLRLRPLQTHRYRDELRLIYHLSTRSFADNYLYTPIGEEEFLDQYEPLESRLRPELVLLAERHIEPVGYVFTIPDWTQRERGEVMDTAILKTVAVLPERRCAGLGAWLVAQAQMAARESGFKRVIHALMHESNASLNLSARYAVIFRKYQLLAQTL